MEVDFHHSFNKKFKKLPKKIQQAFGARLMLFKTDKYNTLLHNHDVGRVYPGCRSINITGDYRAVFEDQGDSATFVLIGTHSELY